MMKGAEFIFWVLNFMVLQEKLYFSTQQFSRDDTTQKIQFRFWKTSTTGKSVDSLEFVTCEVRGWGKRSILKVLQTLHRKNFSESTEKIFAVLFIIMKLIVASETIQTHFVGHFWVWSQTLWTKVTVIKPNVMEKSSFVGGASVFLFVSSHKGR